jgi:hypothetical protein
MESNEGEYRVLMRFEVPSMRQLTKFAILFSLIVCSLLVVAQQKPAILPQSFAGWEMAGTPQTGSNATAVDQAHPAVLKEYGFTDFEVANYSRPERKLTIKAARFQDATGAYGAFTFYRKPNMQKETISQAAASDNERVLFFRDNILIEAQFDHVTAMSASELRELASALPNAKGNAANLPTLPNYLPREQLVPNSAKFMVGPVAVGTMTVPVAADQIKYELNPEILLARYLVDRQTAEMMMIAYPTPQIATERLRAIEASAPPQDGTTMVARRAGPIVAVVKGMISEGDAKKIVGRVNYEADVTWNENVGTKRDNIGNLIVAAFMLIGIILVISLGTGVLFGFGRVILRRLFPGRFVGTGEEADFIRLNLKSGDPISK